MNGCAREEGRDVKPPKKKLADKFRVSGTDVELAGGGSAGFAHAFFPFDEG